MLSKGDLFFGNRFTAREKATMRSCHNHHQKKKLDGNNLSHLYFFSLFQII